MANKDSNDINSINNKIKQLLMSYNESYKPNISSNNSDIKKYISKHGNNINTRNEQNDTTSSRSSYNALIFSKSLTKLYKYKYTDLQSKIKERRIMFWGISIYFIIMTIAVGIFICLPQYSDNLKRTLIYGFFANLIGLLFVICRFDFSSIKYDKFISLNNMEKRLCKLLKNHNYK